MNRQPNVAIRTLGMLALIAVTLAPATRNDADAGRSSAATNAGASDPAPIIVAQGRCFNGRCF